MRIWCQLPVSMPESHPAYEPYYALLRAEYERVTRPDALNAPVMCGGVIRPDDALELRRMGVADVLGPGTLTPNLVTRISAILA